MDIIKHYLTKNECYIRGKKHEVDGVVVHSTGANNPNLNRYIDLSDLLGPNRYGNHWDQYRPGGRQVCVHAFIGLDKNKEVKIIQTLPWDMVGWHVGGKGNYMGYVGFEICEDVLTDPVYFSKAMDKAQELCAYLMKTYDFGIDDVISHHEAYLKGIGSNHGDIDHWLKKHGKDMKWFRSCVLQKYNGNTKPAEPEKPVQKPSTGLPSGVEPYNGYVEVIYDGKDGLNLHSKSTFDGSVSEVVHKGVVLTVIGRIKVDGVWMYYTKGKHYVTSAKQYVSYRTTLHGKPSKPAPTKPKMTARQFALDVWYKGKYGTGNARKTAAKQLGVDYKEVQRLLNKLAAGQKI